MVKRTLDGWLLEHARGITVRNLFPQSPDVFFEALPHAELTLYAASTTSDKEEDSLCLYGSGEGLSDYTGTTTTTSSSSSSSSSSTSSNSSNDTGKNNNSYRVVEDSVNPYWLLSDVHIRMKKSPETYAHWKDSHVLHIKVRDTQAAPGSESEMVLQSSIDLSSLVFLGAAKLEDLMHLPFNAIFLETDSGLWATEDTHQGMRCLGSPLIGSPTCADEDEDDNGNGGKADVDDIDDDERDKLQRKQKIFQEVHDIRTKLSASVSTSVSKEQKDDTVAKGAIKTDIISNKTNSLDHKHKLQELEKWREAATLAEQEADEEEKALALEMKYLQETEDLQSHLKQCEILQQRIGRAEKEREDMRELGSKARFLLEARQIKLLSELQTIYPIEPHWPSSSEDKDSHQQLPSSAATQSSFPPQPPAAGSSKHTGSSFPNQQITRWAIRGMELPPFDGPAKDDEQLATVLGYISHVIVLLAKYQQINLRYQLLYYSSRSMIRDPTANGGSIHQNMPLYRTNAEPEKFRKAIFWLEKNVEQILLTKGLNYDSSKNMLQNLHLLFRNELIPQFS